MYFYQKDLDEYDKWEFLLIWSLMNLMNALLVLIAAMKDNERISMKQPQYCMWKYRKEVRKIAAVRSQEQMMHIVRTDWKSLRNTYLPI